MRVEPLDAVHAVCRWLVWLASLLAPGPYRAEWRRKLNEELSDWRILADRGELPARPWGMLACAFSLFQDTLRLRIQLERSENWSGRKIRSPLFPFCAIGAAVVLLAVCTHWFAGTRSLLGSLPYADPDRIVLFRTSLPFGGVRVGIRSTTLELWRSRSQTISPFASYLLRGGVARVSPEFFDLLGVPPVQGRTFRPADRPGCCRVVRAGTSAPGVIGTMPRGFWFRLLNVDEWVPLGQVATVQAMGRLKPGVTLQQAQEELRRIAREAPLQPRIRYTDGTRVVLEPVGQFMRSPVYACGAWLAGALGMLLTYILLRARLGRERYGWRYWAYLWGKTAFLTVVLAAFWLESTAQVSTGAGDLLFTWVFTVISLGALFLSFLDQRRRCPVCLHRLTLPVSIGSWSSALIDPVSTELVCEQGHGTLYVAETASSDREPELWTPLDASWREVFHQPDRKE